MGFCYLLNTESLEQFELVAISKKTVSYEIQYDQIQLYRGVGFPVEYRGQSGLSQSFTVGLVDRLLTDTVEQTFKKFQNFSKPIGDTASPPILIFHWGQQEIFSPCILIGNVTYEPKNIGDYVANAELSFSLLQLPESMIV